MPKKKANPEESVVMGIDNNLKALWEIHQSNHDTPYIYQEVELLSDARITGEFNIGPVQYYLCDFGDPYPNHPLRHAIGLNCYNTVSISASNVAKELAGIMVVFLRRRIWAGKVTREKDRPARDFSYFQHKIDPKLVEASNITNCEQWIIKVLSLPSEDYSTIMAAVGLYHAAVMIIEQYPQVAYINLVSSIEVLAGHFYGKRKPNIGDCIQSGFKELLERFVDTEEGRAQFIEWQYTREKMQGKFIGFVEDTVPTSFWDASNFVNDFDQLYSVDKAQLNSVLKLIYDRRSKLLHQGLAFPRHALSGGNEWASKGIIDCGDDYQAGEAIPAVRWFERLVNSCIKNYIEILSNSN